MKNKSYNLSHALWGFAPCRLAAAALLRCFSRGSISRYDENLLRAYRQKNAIFQHLKTVPRGLANV